MKEKLLLHVCCASCAVYVYQKLSVDYQVTCFFYNPNIHPRSEYESRKEELERIRSELRLLRKRSEDLVNVTPLERMRLKTLEEAEKEILQKIKQ